MSHCLASTSRWLVGSSRSSRSLPAKRMRVSSTRRRSPPDSAVIGRSSRSAPRPRPAAMRRTSESAAYPPASRNASSASLYARTLRGDGSASTMRWCSSSSAAARRVETAARQHVRERGAVEPGAARRRILRQVADRARAGSTTPAAAGVSPDEHLQQRGLADAVAADETDLVAGAQRERGAGQREPATDFDGEIADLEHG